MTAPKSSPRAPHGVTEVKLLLTSGSLAAILLGWGGLAAEGKASQDSEPVEGPLPGGSPSDGGCPRGARRQPRRGRSCRRDDAAIRRRSAARADHYHLEALQREFVWGRRG